MQPNAIQHLLRAKPLWQQQTTPLPSNQNQLGIAVTQPKAITQSAQPSFNFHLLLACLWATLLQSPIAFGVIAFAAVTETLFQLNKKPFAIAPRNWTYALLNGVLVAFYFLN